ncbi:transcriptional repressor [Rhodanobacter sp. C05]|uniref:transcriptional repressor n=1 Tax=Rhodanobacter sp. C05 TaxID=1945855 RepID=UPI0009CE6961|nr:transcriptional repressor [Rhodanobacter sp. C05]OOG38120.1 hypothetical protein B0E51_14805 [Rhodanobacter sp. C05]
MTEAAGTALVAWEARCKSLGMLMTAPRRAILAAMLQLGHAHDAVTLLQAAREHHAATSIGTVYRWLRELKQLGLIEVQLQPHGRTRWRLHDATPEQVTGSIHMMMLQVQHFLRELEKLGFVEALPAQLDALAAPVPTSLTAIAIAVGPLHEIAECLGYRLA